VKVELKHSPFEINDLEQTLFIYGLDRSNDDLVALITLWAIFGVGLDHEIGTSNFCSRWLNLCRASFQSFCSSLLMLSCVATALLS
jgi:hypothetical protein